MNEVLFHSQMSQKLLFKNSVVSRVQLLMQTPRMHILPDLKICFFLC